MYKVIGADGREYGPVTPEQLRQWIAEGRANAQTQVQSEGSAEWKSLGELAEVADLLEGSQPSPGAAPVGSVDHATPEWQAAPVVVHGSEIDIGSCIQRAWNLWKANFGLMVAVNLVTSVLLGGVGSLISLAVRIPFGVHSLAGIVAGIGANALWCCVLAGALMGGLFAFNLKLIRGQPASFADAFAGFGKSFGALTATYIVMMLLVYLGLALCLIPGIYLAIAWIFALPLVIDKNLGFWEAMELSRKVVAKNWWMIFALALLAGLVGAAGIVACCIGVLFTAPLTYAVLMYAYEDIFGPRTAQTV
ncbi:MAG: GYF domain-containing protein [Verrucomicrobiia bacterium]|jgi:hypothetical protein